MIRSLRVENFKALRDVTVDLEPLTVLIGPNDTGKSSFLEALYAIAASTRYETNRCFWSSFSHRELVHSQSTETLVKISVILANDDLDGEKAIPGDLLYSLSLDFYPKRLCLVKEESFGGEQQSVFHHPEKSTHTIVYKHNHGVQHSPLDIQLYTAFIEKMLRPSFLARWELEELPLVGRVSKESLHQPFDTTGFGFTTALADLKLFSDDQFLAVQNEFCRLFSDYNRIAFKPTTGTERTRRAYYNDLSESNGEGYELFLFRKDGTEVPAAQASAGMLVSLAFLTLTHLPEPINLLLIEEPENGLHPALLGEIISVLRKAVESQPNTQVVLTTHSPLLLDHARPEEVRVFQRDDHGDIAVHNLADVPDIDERLKYLMLGELVYNEGEADLVREIHESENTESTGSG